MTVVGIGFAWLQIRSESLVAPVVAHATTSCPTFAATWALAE